MKSGHYIKLGDSDSVEKIAEEYKVSKNALLEHNEGKNFIPGEWVFIPLQRGIIADLIHPSSFDPSKFIKSGEFLWPVPTSATISSGYGRRWGRMHEGVDIPAKIGASIVAAADGQVVYAGNEMGGYGNILVLAHKDGLFTVYAHVKKIIVDQGTKVFKGQVIALVGNTGRSSGPHLHFEVRKNGESMDPQTFIVSNS